MRFKGHSKATEVEDERIFDKSLFEILPRLDDFLELAIVKKRPVPVSILREKTQANYPKGAIRELLMNALMHRDYQSNMPTRFYEFDDRIEIMNPGGLYGEARPENFPFVNDYRNPVVSEGMKIMGYVNKFNRGIANVQEMLEENGNVEACFNVDKITVFEVVVNIAKDFIVQMDNALNGQRNVQKDVQKELTERQLDILFYIQMIDSVSDNKDVQLNIHNIALKYHVSDKTVYRDLSRLKQLGLVERLGSRKDGRWILSMTKFREL